MPKSANQAASDFVNRAVGNEMFEVRTAPIAAVRAKAPAVRAFAILMAKDHAASTAELRLAIAESGQNLPAPTVMSDHLQSQLDELRRGTGSDFDKTYIEQQIEAHEDALGLLAAYARDGGIPSIKRAASQLEPAVRPRAFIVGEPRRQRSASPLARRHELRGREAARVLFQPFYAEQLGPNGSPVVPGRILSNAA